MFKHSKLVSALAVAGVTLFGAAAAQAQVIKMDGSSTVYPISEAVAEEFQKAKKNAIKVTVGISGTGGGFKKFCRDETDISNASRPITAKEMEDCKAAGIEYIEMPVAFDALTVVVNPKNAFLKEATVAELKTLWEPAAQGKVMKWNQVNPAWPDAAGQAVRRRCRFRYLRIFHRSHRRQGQVLAWRLHRFRRRQRAGPGRVARRQCARLLRLRLLRRKQGQVEGAADRSAEGRRRSLAPPKKSVIKGTYQPLSRPIFIYVKAKSLDKPEVKEFIEFYMKHGAALTKEVKYVPLPAAAYTGNLEHAKMRRVGTVFGGHNEVGITVEDLMKREAKM